MKVLQLRTRDGRDSVLLRTGSANRNTAEDAKLVFNRYGDHYFFAQAWYPGESIGMQAQKSGNEKQLARELAANKLAKEVVAIRAWR